MSEKELQSTLVQAASLTGWLVYHTHDSRRSAPGFPDLVLVHAVRGEIAFIECKAEKGRLTEDQQRWLAALESVAEDVAEGGGSTAALHGNRPINVGVANPDTLDSWLNYITKGH